MRKRVLLALVLVFALLASTSCSLIVKDEEVDKQTVIIEVAGKTITKGEVQDMTQSVLDYNEYMYSMYYGYGYDKTNAETIASAQAEAIDNLIQKAVVDQKVAEGGYNNFTDEEIAEMEKQAVEDYQLYYDTIKMYFFSDTELTGDELDAAIKAEMLNMGYPDEEGILEEAKMNAASAKLQEEMVKDVTVSEDELAAEYASRLEAAKTTYGNNPGAYGTAASSAGSTVYYTPAGYRTVKHILVKFTEEDQTAIDELNAQMNEKVAAGEDVTELKTQLDEKTEAAYAAIMPTIEEIQAKLAEGADFNALITEYNQDPGMTAESEGYLVHEASTNWVPEFTAASMALANIGDVSEPVKSSYGIHLIQYVGDVAEGEIGLETVREDLTAELLSTKQSEKINATLEQWIADANAKVYEERMK